MTAITRAVVMAGPDDAARTVAGVPLLLRTVLALQRADVTDVTIVGGAAPVDPRVRITVRSVAAAPAGPETSPHFVVGPGTVFDVPVLQQLRGAASDHRAVEAAVDGAWVRVVPGGRLAERARAVSLTGGTLAPATAAGLEHRLLRGLENHRDGYLDHLLHRRFSRAVTHLLLRTPIAPNGVTVLGVLIGLIGGWLLGTPGVIAAVAAVGCLVLSGVLDCSDGELARIRFAESRIGHTLDVTGDTLVHAVLLWGIARRMAAAGGAPDWTTLGVLGAGIVGAFAVITWAEVTEDRRLRVACWENRVIAGVLSPLTTRDWHVFPVVFALAGRLDVLVPAGAVGAHVFWIVTLVILVRVLRKTSGPFPDAAPAA